MRTVEVASSAPASAASRSHFTCESAASAPSSVLERTGVNAGASGVQPGGVRRQWSTREHCLLAHESYEYYRDLGAHIEAPAKPPARPCGYLFVAHSAAKREELAANVELQNASASPPSVEPARVAEIVPGLDPSSLTGAAWCATDGYFDQPQAVVEAFAEAARQAGAELEIAEVVELLPDDGRWRVRLADGELEARHVVLAAGYDSRALASPLGLELPIVKEQRFLFLSQPVHERLLEPLLVSAERRFAAKQLANGRVLASDLTATGDPESDADRWRQTVRAGVEELTPILSFVPFDLLIDGFYDVTPDHREILGPVAGPRPLARDRVQRPRVHDGARGRARARAWIAGEDPGDGGAELRYERFQRDDLRDETQVV